MQKGFLDSEGNTYYLDPNTGEMHFGWLELDGEKYYFDDEGHMYRLKQKVGDKYYFFGRYTGKMQKGWLKSENKVYYLDPGTGIMTINNRTIEGVEYKFNSDGTLISQYISDGIGIRYIYADGSYADDWVHIAGEKAFFNSLGYLVGKNVKKVIDVSKWNNERGVIDWATVKTKGDVDAAIIRAAYRGYGSAGTLVEDPYFAENAAGAKAQGIQLGAYFFSQAINVSEGREEANMIVDLINREGGKSTFSLPIVFDSEFSTCQGRCGRADHLSKKERTDIAIAFLETVKSRGYTPMLYASKNFLYDNLDMSRLLGYKLWVAQYNHYCNFDGTYDMWQYSSTETVTGMPGATDVSVWYS